MMKTTKTFLFKLKPGLILLSLCLALLLSLLIHSDISFAAIQLDDTFKPSNLPDNINIIQPGDDVSAETAISRSIILFVGNLVGRILLFAGTVSIIFIIVAGFNYISAFGKDEKIEKGKRGIFWAVVGLLIIMMSYAIVQGILSALQQVDSLAVLG